MEVIFLLLFFFLFFLKLVCVSLVITQISFRLWLRAMANCAASLLYILPIHPAAHIQFHPLPSQTDFSVNNLQPAMHGGH